MKRKVCSLLLMAVLVCSLLTACGGSGGSVSGPNGSYPTGNNEISTRFDQMYTDYYRTGSGDRVFTSSGWHWDYTYYYKLHINITIKNTGNTVAYSVQRSSRYLRIIIGDDTATRFCHPDFCRIGIRHTLRNMNMDRFQRCPLVAPKENHITEQPEQTRHSRFPPHERNESADVLSI